MVRLPARVGCLLLLLYLVALEARAQAPDGLEDRLAAGRLREAEQSLEERLKADAKDDNAHFALGVVQFLRAVEARAQGFHRHGYRSDTVLGNLRMTNLPIPANAEPQPIDADGLRAMLVSWVSDLARVDATLATVKSPEVKLPLHFGMVRLDLDGDGKAGEEETLWRLYARFNRQANLAVEDARRFTIAFDRGDVDWLRGYCHLLSALAEMVLAHDFRALFEETGYLMFAGAKPPQPFLALRAQGQGQFNWAEALDFIAAIHLVRLPVIEPRRLTSALAHLEAMIALSRSSWKFIQDESDDDAEWVPNPKQGTVVPNGRVTPEMIQGWNDFLDEFASILAGKTLAPFWRGDDPKVGINVRRVFTDPRPFDLVLWIRGSAAAPYLEHGEISQRETWARLNRIFGGEFVGFAMWFN
jgi:hypothetical protein